MGTKTKTRTDGEYAVVAQTLMLPISKISNNTGQVEGLPKNPRFIRDEQYEALKRSIREAPEMLTLRELLVYPHGDMYVVIGGNMRLRVLKELGEKLVPCKILAPETPVEKLREYTIKDNTSGGEWDWDTLANEWDEDALKDWGLELPDAWGKDEPEPEAVEDDFDEAKDKIMAVVALGDIWKLGDHLLMCGDSTDAGAWALLLDGNKADMVFTDPPYGVSIGDKNKTLNSVQKAGRCTNNIANDTLDVDSLYQLLVKAMTNLRENCKDDASYYVSAPQGGGSD